MPAGRHQHALLAAFGTFLRFLQQLLAPAVGNLRVHHNSSRKSTNPNPFCIATTQRYSFTRRRAPCSGPAGSSASRPPAPAAQPAAAREEQRLHSNDARMNLCLRFPQHLRVASLPGQQLLHGLLQRAFGSRRERADVPSASGTAGGPHLFAFQPRFEVLQLGFLMAAHGRLGAN